MSEPTNGMNASDGYLWPAMWVSQAVDQLRTRWNQSPDIQRDFVPEYEALQAWFWVPNCYSLLEQAFKLLWAIRNQAPPTGFKKWLFKAGKKAKLAHDIGFIFSQLDVRDRAEIEEAFRAYRKLHDYIPVDSATELTEHIGGDGYTNWRYFLLEGSKGIPATDVGVMIEIAFASSGIIEREQHGGSGYRTVDQRIAEGLREALFQVVTLQMVAVQTEPNFEIANFRSLWDQRWANVSKLVAESPGSMYLALAGNGADAKDPGEWAVIEALCAQLPECDLKNFKMHFFKKANVGRPRGVDNDAFFLKLHRDEALYELRRFTQCADARDIESVKRAIDYLSSMASEMEFAGISKKVGTAMEQIAGKGLPANPPLSGDVKFAVEVLASFQQYGSK